MPQNAWEECGGLFVLRCDAVPAQKAAQRIYTHGGNETSEEVTGIPNVSYQRSDLFFLERRSNGERRAEEIREGEEGESPGPSLFEVSGGISLLSIAAQRDGALMNWLDIVQRVHGHRRRRG